MVIVWNLRGNIIRTSLCWIVWHNVHSPQHTYVSSSYRSNRLGLLLWDPYTVRTGGCLELYYCNMVEWFWWDSSLISKTNWFPSMLWRCWYGLVIWPVKIVPEMTYCVSSGTLNTTHSLTQSSSLSIFVVMPAVHGWSLPGCRSTLPLLSVLHSLLRNTLSEHFTPYFYSQMLMKYFYWQIPLL